jgi:hypothetical protein
MRLICPRCRLRPKAETRGYCRVCLSAASTAYNARMITGHGPRSRSMDTLVPSSLPELTGWAIDRRCSSLEADNTVDIYFTITHRTYRDRGRSDALVMGPGGFKVKRPRRDQWQ